ncbi:nucleoside deaminase [Salinigranum sp. GCM10025319]|uniref:nucleoside deaminase n=1 Tax=Salinigranum sp. GCM10025319 TaxID=3252687 RepID=UPI00360711BF
MTDGTDAAATEIDERFLRRALELAREAAAENTPFGSLLVRNEEILVEATNTTLTDDDVTAHPELKLARWAARELTPAERRETTMYTSTYPCMMCSGALAFAGIGRLVYSVDGETAARLAPDGTNDDPPTTDYLRERGDVTVVGPLLQSEGEAVHRECWDGA